MYSSSAAGHRDHRAEGHQGFFSVSAQTACLTLHGALSYCMWMAMRQRQLWEKSLFRSPYCSCLELLLKSPWNNLTGVGELRPGTTWK